MIYINELPIFITLCFLFLPTIKNSNYTEYEKINSGLNPYSTSTMTAVKYEFLQQYECHNLNGLSSDQEKYCQLYPDHMEPINRGVKSGLAECEWQFKNERWNCSANKQSFLGLEFATSNREAAFANAMTTAGIVYSISRACKEGNLMTCGCSKDVRPVDLHTNWIWGGCAENVKYGYRFALGFLDMKKKPKTSKKINKNRARSLANIHNYDAGGKIVSKLSHVTCKCHGVSGSCTVVTCWQQLPSIREIGDYLKTKYDSAVHVKTNRRGRLKMKYPRLLPPTIYDLVYVDESPNYCIRNLTIGSLGTEGRLCDKDSHGPNGCKSMCCNRGYNSRKLMVKERCECTFHWCCYVKCNICTKISEIITCK